MRSKSPELMERINQYIGDYYRQHHSTPTTREIAAEMGISNASGYNYLVSMASRGMITYENGKITGLPKITKTETSYFSAPLVGSIRCGDPESEEEQVEMYLNLPEAIFGKGEFYLLRAAGDSMVDSGISEGDLVLIRKQTTCDAGDIVVAMDENRENTLKIYDGIDRDSSKAVLKYSNKAKYPDKKILVNELTLQGVARYVIHSL